jgi:hypothetical protein
MDTANAIAATITSIGELNAALLAIDDLDLRASIFLSLTGPGASLAGSFGTGSDRTSDVRNGGTVNGVNVTNHFNTTPVPTTDTQRITQSVASVIRSNAQ